MEELLICSHCLRLKVDTWLHRTCLCSLWFGCICCWCQCIVHHHRWTHPPCSQISWLSDCRAGPYYNLHASPSHRHLNKVPANDILLSPENVQELLPRRNDWNDDEEVPFGFVGLLPTINFHSSVEWLKLMVEVSMPTFINM